jgi:hypothetical protein
MGIGVKITLIQLKKMIQPKKKMISSPKVKITKFMYPITSHDRGAKSGGI